MLYALLLVFGLVVLGAVGWFAVALGESRARNKLASERIKRVEASFEGVTKPLPTQADMERVARAVLRRDYGMSDAEVDAALRLHRAGKAHVDRDGGGHPA